MRWARSLVVAVAALLMAAGPAAADDCYGSNAGATGKGNSSQSGWYAGATGVKGQFRLRPATPASGTAIAHPSQVGDIVFSEFLGLGTYKGLGASGAGGTCSNNLGSSWRTHLDGVSYGVYFCTTLSPSYANEDSATHSLELVRKSGCGGDPATHWCAFLDGTLRGVKDAAFSSGVTSAGGESVGSNTQVVNVDYKSMSYRQSGVTSCGRTWEGASRPGSR